MLLMVTKLKWFCLKIKMVNLIIAPEPSDEIVGCYGVILKREIKRVFIYYPNHDEISEPGIARVKKLFGIDVVPIGFLDAFISSREDITIYAPDHYSEPSPEHKRWGSKIEFFYRDKIIKKVYFYSISMLSPFIFKVPCPISKKSTLSSCYLEKKDKWSSNENFFMFEGSILVEDPYSGFFNNKPQGLIP